MTREAPEIGVVAIGRNEGERLVRCLASARGPGRRLVYVDSGSTDDSVTNARAAGAEVVELDLSTPFTAARARNAGFAAMTETYSEVDYVQFIDGDCGVKNDWLDAASAALTAKLDLGIVTGWRSEIDRDHSVYNQMCDVEWHQPPGDINACGGDMMVRRQAFEEVGGFNPSVIAAEDDEFCIRIRKAGWRIERLARAMTIHDAAMTRFGQWWRRATRAGHGFAQVGALHPDYFVPERRRTWFYGAGLPLLALIFLFVWPWGVLGVLGVYLASYLRTAQGLMRAGLPWPEARLHAVFLTISKFPGLIGMLTFWWRRMLRRNMILIEYK